MIIHRRPGVVVKWFVAFHVTAATPWVRWLPGRHKHVSAFGFSPEAGMWVLYNPAISQTMVMLIPDSEEGRMTIAAHTENATVIRIDAAPPVKPRVRLRLLFCCTVAVRHLLGLPGGALLPDALLRDCLRNGASLVHGFCEAAGTGPGTGSEEAAIAQ